MLPTFDIGTTVVMSEDWRGRLWSAVPERCIASTDRALVTYVPGDAVASYASNRDLPATKDLPRSERKLEAMQTCVYEIVERSVGRSSLRYYEPDSWAAVYLGWNRDGSFWGWYVNFQRPLAPAPGGLQSKDLALDLLISPDGTHAWKDQDEFDTALQRGIFDGGLRDVFRLTTAAVLDAHRQQRGAFEPKWESWQPDPSWPAPELPDAYRARGRHWALPPFGI